MRSIIIFVVALGVVVVLELLSKKAKNDQYKFQAGLRWALAVGIAIWTIYDSAIGNVSSLEAYANALIAGYAVIDGIDRWKEYKNIK